MNKLGTRFHCDVCGGELMVTKNGDGSVGCCAAWDELALAGDDVSAPTLIGKRYACDECKSAFICLKPSTTIVTCCSKPVTALDPQELPSSD